MAKTVQPPTSTVQHGNSPAAIARRMLAEAAAARDVLPIGYDSPSGADVLLALLIAEDRGDWPTVESVIGMAGMRIDAGSRWLSVLTGQGLVERRSELLALTAAGYEIVASLTARVQAAQWVEEPMLS